jgi:phage shock protein A
MAESIFVRVGRLVSASIEDALDSMERAGGVRIMRESIREVERAIDDVRTGQEDAIARRLQAVRQQRLFRDKLVVLEEQAIFAIAEKRDDLAEAAVSRQIDHEAQAERLGPVATEAAEEADRLEHCLVALTARKAEMEEALAAFESAGREATLPNGDKAGPNIRRTVRKVERAEAAFERGMAGAGGVVGISRSDAETVAKVAELSALQKRACVAERLAALKSAHDAR